MLICSRLRFSLYSLPRRSYQALRLTIYICCHFLLQGGLPNPGIEPRSLALEADTLTSEPPGKILGSSSVSPSVVSDSFVTPWTVAHQASLSMEFSRQEYLSGLPFPSPGDLPNSGIKPGSPALQADSLPSELPGRQRKFRHKIF